MNSGELGRNAPNVVIVSSVISSGLNHRDIHSAMALS